jgi:hypothetical protein
MRWGVRNDRYRHNRDGVVIKKGAEIHRVAGTDQERHEGHAFASYKEGDAKRYRNRAKFFSKIDGQAQYDMTMKVTKDLVIPSEQARVDAFIEMFKNDPQAAKDLAEAVSKIYVFKDTQKLEAIYKTYGEKKLRTKGYKDLAIGLLRGDTLRSKYFDTLSKKGYNATVDDVDAKVLADTPIVVFDRKKSLTVVNTKKL